MLVTSRIELELVLGTRDFARNAPESLAFVNIRDDKGRVTISKAVWDGIPSGKKKKIIRAAKESIKNFLQDNDFLLLEVAPTFEEPEVNTSSARLYFKIVRKRRPL